MNYFNFKKELFFFSSLKIHWFILEYDLYSFNKLFVAITKHPLCSPFNLFLKNKLSKKKKFKLSSEKVIKLLFFYLKYSLSNTIFLFVTEPLIDLKILKYLFKF